MTRLAVLVIALFVLVSAVVKREVLRFEGGRTKLKIHQQAPALVLHDTTGNTVDLHAVAKEKRLVLVTFWATWCVPCRVELPQLEKLYAAKRAAGLEILAVNEDEQANELLAYLKERPLPFPVLIDTGGKIAAAYGVEAFPTTVLVDRHGRIVQVESGLMPYAEAMIDAHLRSKSKSDG